VGFDAEKIVHSRNVAAGRREIDEPPVARPRVQLFAGVVEGQSLQLARFKRQRVDVAIASPRRDESQPFAVWRIERTRFVRRMRDEQSSLASISRRGPDVPTGYESDIRTSERHRRLREIRRSVRL